MVICVKNLHAQPKKILAGSSKTTVVLFVIQLLLLFDKTESSESSESGESGESGESNESGESFFRQFAKLAVSDSTDSMRFHFQSKPAGQ